VSTAIVGMIRPRSGTTQVSSTYYVLSQKVNLKELFEMSCQCMTTVLNLSLAPA